MGGAPPPPPAPAAAASGGDMQAELMNMLKDPNLRNRLKKRAPPPEKKIEKPPDISPEEQQQMQEAEKQELFIELLGYMEAPNGNIEELIEKNKTTTSTCRSFIYTLIRRNWVEGCRVVEEVVPGAPKITVWPGREWMAAVELADMTEQELHDRYHENSGIVARCHMYRFDQILKRHVLDEVALIKAKKFPKAPPPFNEPEPPQDNSLENRKKWEDWNIRKQNYLQSDFPQFELIFQKLLATDAIVSATFAQMQQTMDEMRRMGEALHTTFEGFTVRQLRKIVQSIPTRIKDVARQLQKQSGIIIKNDELKVTPEFLKNMGLSSQEEDGVKKKEEAEKQKQQADKAAPVDPSVALPNPKGSITMGGVPVDVLIPLLKKSYALGKEESKLRRLTM
ncbi:hypothetical protein HK101_000322 [Irineochytrium annulatum]|nr:hypothetical protein HK101_000322 [Irineochytrium annulatum]